jgi:putative membrane protein
MSGPGLPAGPGREGADAVPALPGPVRGEGPPRAAPGPADRDAGGAGAGGAVDGTAEAGWQRLDRRALLLKGVLMTGVAGGIVLPVLLGLSSGAWFGSGPRRGTGLTVLISGAVLLVAGAVAAEALRHRKTLYRVGPGRVELRSGLLLVKRRSLARERIRSVDLAASPLLRLLGLVKVRIGTGEQSTGGDSTLELNPVARAEGDRLRAELLDRPAAPDRASAGVLASVDPAWIVYAPASFVAPLLGGAAAGAVLQASDFLGRQQDVIRWVGDRFQDTSLVLMIVLLVTAAVVAGGFGALGLWVEMWWAYRLEREPGGTLRVRRGLLTKRSITVEERRLRGVELVEPLGVRLLGAARVDAVATGLAQDDKDRHADLQVLLPPVPRGLAGEVAGQVLREPVPPFAAPLTPHPPAARRRRLFRALVSVLVPAASLTALGLWLTPVLVTVAVVWTLLGLPLAVLLALDAYRALGHTVSGGYLITRSGTFRRATVALQRQGVIGWTVSQSFFQRRAGVLTLTATTAAGAGGYSIHDAAEGEGLAFAAGAVPGLLAPFLEGLPAPAPEPDGTTHPGADGCAGPASGPGRAQPLADAGGPEDAHAHRPEHRPGPGHAPHPAPGHGGDAPGSSGPGGPSSAPAPG